MITPHSNTGGIMSLSNAVIIVALTLTVTIISTINMNQNNEIEILKSRVLVLEGKK